MPASKARAAPRRSLRSAAQPAPPAEPEPVHDEESPPPPSGSFDAASLVPDEPPLELPEPIHLFSRTIKLAAGSKQSVHEGAVFVPTAYETLRRGLVDWFPEHASLRQLQSIASLTDPDRALWDRLHALIADDAAPPAEPSASASSSERKRPRKVKIELKARLRPSARVGKHCDLLCGSPASDHNVGAFELHVIASDEVCKSLYERGRFASGHTADTVDTVERPTLLLGHVVPALSRNDGTVGSMAPELFQQEWLGFEKHSVRVTLEAPFLVPDILIGPAALHPVGRSVPFQGPAVAPGFRPVVRRDPIGGNEYTSDMRARVPPRSIVGQLSFSVQLQNAAFDYGRVPGADPYPRSETSGRERKLPRLLGPFLNRVLADPTGALKYDLSEPDFWSSGGGHYPQWTREECEDPGTFSALADLKAGSASMKLPLNNSIDVLLESCRPATDSPAVYPPEALVPTPLKLYQAQAVAWMVRREKRSYQDAPMLYPQWTALSAKDVSDASSAVKAESDVRPKKKAKRASTASEVRSKSAGPTRASTIFYIDEVTGMPSLRPFRGLVSDRGGALCDGLGLGKSLETLSLIVMRPKGNVLDPSRSATLAAELPADLRPLPVRATLIVTPAALLEQWHAETAKHTPSLRVIRWQSSTLPWKANDLRTDTRAATHAFFEDDAYDVILTSYEQLSAELLRSTRVSKAESAQSPLLEILWHRIVLDEAQLIAGSSASAAEICSCLWRTASWVVTSTPCASIGELSGIFSFLDLDPFADPQAFETLVADGFEAGEAESIRRASGLCRNIMWRNSRVHVADQLGLPPSSEVVLTTKMTGLQRTIYEREAQLVKAQIEDAVKRGLKNVKHILGPFQQLRQLLDHPQLAERLGYGSSDTRRSFEDLTTNLMRRLTRELKVKRLERATLVLAIVAGQRAFEAEKRPGLWRGGVPVWTEDDINVQCRAALAACNTALDDEEQIGLDEQDLDDAAAVPELPRPKGTRRLTLEEAIYWLRTALGEKRLAPPQHYEPERMTIVFFQRDFVLQEKVDMTDPRYHPVSVDAGEELELRDDDDDGVFDSQPKKKKGRSEFEAPTLKANKLRGVEKRKRARAWHWVPRHKLETMVHRLQASKERADQLSHERAYLQSCIDEERQRNGGGNDEGAECMICLSVPDIRALLPCLHGGCFDCLLDLIKARNKRFEGSSAPCPICREPFTAKRIIQVLPKEDVLDAATAEFGCKIAALVKDIQARLVADPHTKCVVFSVFKRMLRLVSEALEGCGIASMAFAGSEEAKSDALARFREDGQVLTVPLAQAEGAAGLTLTMANVSYFLEPVLDPSLESQAKGRLLRIGQTRPVTLVRVLIEGTIEPAIANMALARQLQMEDEEGNEDAAAAVTRGEKNDVSLAELVDVFSVASLDALEQAAAADRVARGQRLDDELLAFEAGEEDYSDSDDDMY